MRKICSRCGTPQQWEIWPNCACGGDFVAPPPRSAPSAFGNEDRTFEHAAARAYRQALHKGFRDAPRNTFVSLTAAIALSAFFRPPLEAVLVSILVAFLGGAFAVYGVITKRDWIPFIAVYLTLSLFLDIANSDAMGTGEPVLALLAWAMFAAFVPFLIWRRRGLATLRCA